MQRTPAVLVTLAGLSSVALGAPAARGLAPLPARLPARCAPLAAVPRMARTTTPAMSAHVSVANCAAEEAMNAVTLFPNDTAITRLGEAVAPSLQILDDVIAVGDPYWQLIAQDAKRDIYTSLVVRMRASIPAGDVASREALEPRLVAWEEDAARAQTAVASLVRANAQVASRDPVIQNIVGHTASAPTAVGMRPQKPHH